MKLDFYMPVRLVSGELCVKTGGDIFKSYGNRCLIVTGGRSAKISGALDAVLTVLSKENISHSIYSEISENPTVTSCRIGGEKAREQKADFIIGIGGGSPLDAAKAIAIFAANENFTNGDIYKRSIPAKALPVLLVGTTSGTGSEVTGVSVLTDDDTNMKKSISGEDCYAKVAFLNPRYADTMPLTVTVSTGLDALSHTVEGWFSPRRTEISKAFGSFALKQIFQQLSDIYKYDRLPNKKGRDELFYGAIYAGLSLNITGASFPHVLGYALTEDFGVSHGRACTAFMPYLVKRAGEFCKNRLDEMLNILGTDEDGFLEIVKGLTNIRLNISEEKIKEYSKRWDSLNKNFINSPGGFTVYDASLALKSLS